MAGNVRVSFVPLTKECYDYFFDPTSNPFVNAFFFLLQLDIVSNRTSFEQFFVAFETSLKEREKYASVALVSFPGASIEDSKIRVLGVLLIYAPRGNFSRSLSPLLRKNSEDRLIGACISGTKLASRMFRVPCNFVGSRRLSPVGSDIKIPRLGRKGGFSTTALSLLASSLSFL